LLYVNYSTHCVATLFFERLEENSKQEIKTPWLAGVFEHSMAVQIPLQALAHARTKVEKIKNRHARGIDRNSTFKQ
jgi:hypothetical protein